MQGESTLNLKITLALLCLIIGIVTCTITISAGFPTQLTQLNNNLQKSTDFTTPFADISGLKTSINKSIDENVITSSDARMQYSEEYNHVSDFNSNNSIVTVSFGEPKHDHFRYHNNQWYTGIGSTTPVILNAVETTFLFYEVYTADSYGVWEYQYSGVVQDNNWPDFNSVLGVITTVIFMDESCWHQLHYWAGDTHDDGNPRNNSSYEEVEFLVDAENPTTTWTYTEPHYYDPIGQFMWITNNTKKQLVITDTGCNPKDSGVYKVDWRVTRKINESWVEINHGIVYDNDINDTDGTPAHPWQNQPGGVWAMDYENRAYTFQDSNKNGSYDPGEPILNNDPDGDGLIAVPHKGDPGGLYALDKFQESFIFNDTNKNFMYDTGDFIITNDPDKDLIPAEPQYGTIGGYYSFDNQSQPYTFVDTNNNWKYDTGEHIASPKPDADGVGTIHMSINISDDGEYHIYHQATDTLGNTGPDYKEYVRVDNTPPTTVNITGTPQYYYYDDAMQKYVFCVTPQTPITLHATDQTPPCAVGLAYFHYEIWFNNTKTFEKNVTLFDEDTFKFQGECIHELRWYAVDLLGNKEQMHNQTYRVDDTPPQIALTCGEPQIPLQNHTWVNLSTPITIDAQNPGCCPFFTVQFRLNRGQWHTITHQLPYHFTFSDECIYELDVMAFDIVGHMDRSIALYYVDDTPPQTSVIKPVDGWYTKGSPIAAIIPAVDEPNHNTPCNDELAVGISPGHPADAFLLDAFPSFQYVLLDGSLCGYNATQEKFLGNLIIPQTIPVENGPVLFGTIISDDLGNMNNTLDILHDLYVQADGDETEFNTLIQPMLTTHQITYIGIDITPPVVTISDPLPGEMIGPNPVNVTALVHDALSGVNAGTACHVFLQGMLLGILQYDPELGGCNGLLQIPDSIESGENVPFTISVTDSAGNIGQTTILVDVTASHANTPPVGFIRSPVEGGIYQNVLSVQVEAHDAETPTEDLQVLVQVTRQNDPTFMYTATYDPFTDNFTIDINISTYTNGTILQINAYVTDGAGYTIITLPVHCSIASTIIFDQWMMVGWNMMNLPNSGSNTTIPHVFSSIHGDFDYLFDSATWDNYKYGRPVNTLTRVQAGIWYWVNMINATRFYLTETG